MTTIIIYEAKDGWRWHMKRSGRIVAESGEAYSSRSKCSRAIDATLKHIKAGKCRIRCAEDLPF